eukprot:SAG11_NODE_626_length_8100_cov_5.500875_7_plen_46_part_00
MLQIETTVKNAKTYELLAANDKERDRCQLAHLEIKMSVESIVYQI